jgi:anti-sigma factor RsiW
MTEAELEALEAQFSNYLDGAMSAEQRAAFENTLAESPEAKAAFDEFKRTVEAISGLHKMAAPQNFETGVEQTIHKRSAGKFFGRRAFGDRVPFELLAIIAMAALLGIYLWIRSSDTGSAKTETKPDGAGQVDPAVKEAIPRP